MSGGRRDQTSRNEYGSKTPCHICELPIRFDLVNVNHPLAGTIDHVIPRSLGGTDVASNRLPAHRVCNLFRQSNDITPELRDECKKRAAAEIAKWKRTTTEPRAKFKELVKVKVK